MKLKVFGHEQPLINFAQTSMTNWFLYLFLLLSPLSCLLLASVSAEVFLSIDCGSSTSFYTDENSIMWVGDKLYIKNGESHDVIVPEVPGFPNAFRIYKTLRAFTSRKKNCYSIDAEKDTDRVFVRASFYYGNYDRKLTPPIFDLHFNGNLWGTVKTSLTNLVYFEAVYSVKGMNSISVCVAQTQPDNLPFISALEVRHLDAGVYSHFDSNYPLFFINRFAFGTNYTVRFPEDAYDRIWSPFRLVSNVSTKVTSDLLSVNVGVEEDNPPQPVVLTAITPSDPSSTFFLQGDFSSIRSPLHINTYFSEVSKLNSTQKRSFRILVNNQLVSLNGSVIPPYGSVLEIRIPNVTASSNTTLELVQTSDSTLPPLINAMEMFLVGDKITEGTNSKDVNALAMLQKSFIELEDWSGDPCLPSTYTWDWVACSDDLDNPRITALFLSNLGLVGTLPDFSDMDALQSIDLHNNSLVQEFPNFLGSFPQLKELNLADNNFSGTLPSSLSENKNMKLNVSGNLYLCLSEKSCETGTGSRTPNSSGHNKLKSTNMLPIILGTVLIVPILVDVFWVIVC